MPFKDKEAKRAYNKARYEANKEAILDQQKEFYKNNKDEKRKNNYKAQYGITLEDYNEMFVNQNGCCKICGRHQSEFKKTLCVDHCHTTGKVRGLLCSNCNIVLGQAKDDIEILKSAIKYLEESI